MIITRRRFLAASAASLAAMGMPVPALGRTRGMPHRDATWFDWKQPKPGIHVAFGEGGNTLVLTGQEAALLVDTKNAPFGAVLRREAGEHAAVTTVLNTHHHADHTAGNCAFTHDLPVVAHEKARARILSQTDRYQGMIRGGVAQVSRAEKPETVKEAVRKDAETLAAIDSLTAESWAPTRTVGDREELDVGGVKVALHHFGPGHTDNDLVVHVPSLNLVHTGDLVFNGMHPYMDPPGGATSAGWVESLRMVVTICDGDTLVIPGHGELTNLEGIKRQIEYFEKVRTAIATAIQEGQTREQVQGIRLPEHANLERDQIRERAFAAIFDELQAGR